MQFVDGQYFTPYLQEMARFIFVIFSLVAVCSGSPINPHIIGGSTADIADYPYMVSIESRGKDHICGGFIISSKWVLTDAWCTMAPVFVTQFTVRSGSALLGNGTGHDVIQWVHHPLNDVTNRKYDFALVQVDPPFEFGENVAPVALATQDQDTPDGAAAIVAGWGMKNSSDLNYTTDHLQVAEVYVFDDKTCSEILASQAQYSKLCARDPNGVVSHCYDDEGGPLVINGTAFGIMLWSPGCVNPWNIAVYSRIASSRDWIDFVIRA